MAIADASDQKWDAGVFLGARSFNSESLNITNFGNFIQDQNDVFEGCNNFFRVERDSSDLSQALPVNLILSGSCINGIDIQTSGNQPFPSSVTIPANAAYIDIPYVAVADGIQDNGETLVISVATSCPCSPVVQYITRTIHIYEHFSINSVSAINAQCNGQNDGAITVQVSGGSGNYLYSIDNGTNWQSLNNFTGLAPGDYIILVQDPGSCYPYESVSVTIGSPSPLAANAGPDTEICAGASTQLNGSGGIQYSWSPATGLNFNNIANPIASPLVTTTYTLTVTNAQGQCSSSDEVTVFVNPGPTPPTQLSVDRTISCADDSGNIQLTALGGNGNSLQWFINSCGGTLIGTGTTLILPSPENTTTYFAWWESSCGHSECAQITVNVPQPINLGDLTINGVSCSELNNGSIVLNAAGGVPPFGYTIVPLTGLQSPAGTFTGLSAQSYTITATDANGCSAATNAIVPLTGDTTVPTIVSCPDPLILPVDTNCFALIPDLRDQVNATDDCSSPANLVATQDPSPGTTVSSGVTVITITITDEAGNSAVCSTSLNVVDLTAPVIEKCSDSIVQYAGTNCLGEIPDFRTDLVVSDNCPPILSLDITQVPAPGTIVTAGLTQVELTVVDEAGNASGCTALFYVLDTISPYIIICPEPVNIILDNACTAIVPDFTAMLSVTDNCTGINEITISQVPAAGSTVAIGTTQITITATDGAGNTAICISSMTVSETQAPVISGPEDITVNADPGLCSASAVNLGYPTATDNCGIPTVTNNAPLIFPVGSTEVIWTATDASGLSATSTQTVTVIDNEPPAIICPPGIITIPDPGQNYASGIDTGLPQTSDNCAVDTVFNNAPAQYPVGITWVTWTVTDIHGLSSTCMQSVIVIDDIEPIVMCPPLIQIECIGEIPAPYPDFSAFVAAGGSATDNDGIDSSTFILVSQTSNNLNCPETVSRVYAVADFFGNYNFCTQNILIDDVTQPLIIAPADVTVECSEIPEPGIATATDNCDAEVTISFEGETIVPGACPDSYTLTRTWKAVDNCGNEATASQTITVQDVTPPVLTIPSDLTVECAEVPAPGTATATDNCDAEVTVTYEGETLTPGSCPDSYILTRTWKAIDNCGNEATASQTITVQDITPPVLSIPLDLTVECSEVPAAGTATATDNCDTDVTVTYEGETQTPGSCPDSYTLTRTWKAVDNCGNEATASQIITVQDITPPSISTPASDLTVLCTGSGIAVSYQNWLSSQGGAAATDNCGSVSWSSDTTSISYPCENTLSVTITFTASDDCNNTSTTVATFSVIDTVAPVLTCPADIIMANDPGLCSANVNVPIPEYTEDCSQVILINSFNGTSDASGNYPVGITLVTWTATDGCGNSDTCIMSITVQDLEIPTIDCPADVNYCQGETVVLGDPEYDDNCEIAGIGNNAPATFPAGTTQVTWTVTDINGNSNSCIQQVNIFPSAIVSAGPDELICEGNTGYTISGASASNYLSVQWTSSGNGTLLNAATLTPTYIPAVNETGNIYLTITALGNPPCGDVTDQMLLTIIPGPVANAGPDNVICEGGSFLISGSSAGYFTSLGWTSSGTGNFDDPSLIHPTYIPSESDLITGSVILTLTVNGSSPCTSATDMMTLEFEKAPIAYAGADTAICQGMVFTITTASASNYQSLLWSHTGTGSLSGSNTITPIYTPGMNETGVVTLTLLATGNEPCGDAEDKMILTIHGSPSVYAGIDDLSCDDSPYQLNTSQVNNYSSLHWYSSGTGSFSDATTLHPVYSPSSADVANGSVTLTLNVQGLPPCDSVSDNVILSFVQRVSVFAGNDTLTCNNQPVTIISSDIQNSIGILWTHNGSGSIENGQTSNPTYVPATGESGYITLYATASGLAPCPAETDSLLIEVVPAAEIFAGPDLTGCDGQPVSISLATASYVTEYLWKTSGNGTFDDPSQLHPVYTPGSEDQTSGTVVLTLEGTGTSPCAAVVDQLTLTILQGPRVNAGADQIQCNSASFVLAGATASNYGDIQWTHNGSGTLSNETTLTPTYTPSAGETGVVTFTITIQGNQYCGSISASDQVSVTLGNPVIANAGPDQLIPLGASTTLQGSITGGSGFNACSWEPSGMLINPNNFNTATTALSSNTLFILTVVDLSTSCTDSDSVFIIMGAANLPPVATVDQDTASVTLPAIIPVLLNDMDPDGTIEEVTILTPPSFGTAILNEDNTITYTPVPGYEGFDTLVYQICDNGMPILCDTALVVIRVFGERPFDDIIIYNYLTPNGDNHNDVWTIDNIQFWPENTVLIFNRWGDRIRTFAHYDNVSTVWDGTNEQGDRLPDGTYYYIVRVTHMDPFSGTLKEDAKTGYVMIKSNRK
jgi:gliding motility-associated-like protein